MARPVWAVTAGAPDAGAAGTLDLRVVEQLCSRILHDLAGPLGAVRNGVELVEELGPEPDALALVADSSRRAATRLRVYRLAYGRGGGSTARGLADARAAVADWLAGGKIGLDWPPPAEEPEPRPGLAKLVLNAVLAADEALPRGGTISVRMARQPDGGRVEVAGRGPALRFEPDLAAVFAGRLDPAEIGARTVQGAVMLALARHYRFQVAAAQTGDDRFFIEVKW